MPLDSFRPDSLKYVKKVLFRPGVVGPAPGHGQIKDIVDIVEIGLRRWAVGPSARFAASFGGGKGHRIVCVSAVKSPLDPL
jgi:hypothetical protein